MRYYWLNFHVSYACRDSGMCCSSGWPIPVERAQVAPIEAAITREQIPLRVVPWLVPDAGAPADVAGTLGLRPNGHCVFFEAGRPGCSIHDVKPAACVHFPYVCLIDQRGVHVTLSHFCPTAAGLLFEHSGPIEIVEGPSPIAAGGALEGLDARDALPPSIDGRRLMSFEEFTSWERAQADTVHVGDWQDDDLQWFERARAAVPAPWSWPQAPEDASGVWWSAVAPSWFRFDDALRCYAAAKMFGSWSAYMGDGLDAVMRTARIATAVLRIESARQCMIFGRPLDRELMTEAIRQTDLLMVHYADPARLAAGE
ncbi:MAG TPA: YkgJ family cysteine cluster protein [Vicinamibacterales bacterium]|nr:YkgJ family cysteine cluster protein [Vicinamibacterales bacterium]